MATDQSRHWYNVYVYTDVCGVLWQSLEGQAIPVHESGHLRKFPLETPIPETMISNFRQAENGSQYDQNALLTNGRFDQTKYDQLGVRLY